MTKREDDSRNLTEYLRKCFPNRTVRMSCPTPRNVLGGIPTIALDYSPAWDAQLYQWTDDAINQGYRGQLREEFQILTFVQDGLITGPGGAAFGSSGFSINCPIVQRLD